MERQIITVDIAPGNNQIQRLKSSQGDIGRPLGVYIIQNGVALDCSAYTADLYILKPDGNFFTGTATVDATEHNLITWETAEQETPVAGDCAAQIRILSNGDDIGTARFVEYVEASPGFCGESSESVIDSLKEYVRQAAASAETASNAASSATGSASAASDSASSAASSASAAAGSASTAHTDAETASQAAQTAQDVADSIPEDYSTLSEDVTGLKSAFEQLNDNVITDSAGPAPIVSIADGADGMPMRSVEVAIEPVQDLHGYDAPWPAGGGKNLLPKPTGTSVTEAGVVWTVNDDGSIKVSGTATGRSLFYYTKNNNIIVNNVKPVYATGSLNGTQLGSGVLVDGVWKNFSTVESISGSIEQVWFDVPSGATVNGVIYPMLVASSETDLSWSPYSNICPISGWTGAKVTRTGKNLLAKPFSYFSAVPNSLDECFFIKAGTYTLSVDSFTGATSWRHGIRLKDAAGNDLSAEKYKPYVWMTWNVANSMWLGGSNSTNKTITITLVEDCYIRIVFAVGDTSASTVANGAMLSAGSTALPYEPYQGQTYEVTFPTESGTVYGGTMDVVRGKLVVDRVIATISDLSVNINFNVGTYTVMKRFFLKIPSNSGIPYNKLHGAIASFGIEGETYYGSQRNNDLGSLKVNYAITSDGKSIAIYDADLSLTDTAFMEKYGNQQVCYPLAATIEYTLTPQEIKTLLGTNNIWADAGNVAITYPADTKLYIDNKIAELQALILENNG